MALVKKLQSGGAVDASFNDELDKQIGNFKLKSKDERKVRDALVKMRDYLGAKDATGRSFTTDEVAQTYTISGEGSEKFAGSPDDISKGWLSGRLKIKDDQDAMSVAAAIYNEALRAKKNTQTPASNTSITPTDSIKEKRKIINLSEFDKTSEGFGSENGLTYTLSNTKTDEGRKKLAMDLSKKAVDTYLKEHESNKDKYDFEDYQDVLKMKQILDNPNSNWDEYLQQSYRLNWSPTDYLLNEEDKTVISQQESADKGKAFGQELMKRGINNPQIQSTLFGGNYSEILSDYKFSEDESVNAAINETIRKNKAVAVRNPDTGAIVIVNQAGQLADFTGKDRFDPLYGYVGRHNEGMFELLGPDVTKGQAEDPNLSNDEGFELKTNLPGIVYGWSSDEEGGEYLKDIMGNRDFTKRLEWISPTGQRKMLKLNENNQYTDDTGKVYDVKISGYGKEKKKYINYGDIPIAELPYTDKNTNWVRDLNNLKDFLTQTKREGRNDISDKMTKTAGRLKWALQNNPLIQTNQRQLDNVLKTILEYNTRLNPGISMNKLGGVIKAQEGIKVKSAQEYMEALKQQRAKAPVGTSAPAKDITGTWKDQSATENALDVASMAGTAASFIPGVGAAGAAVAFGADLAKDLSDGKLNNIGTHALNLGFIALSAIGLGGVKALIKGAQATKKAVSIGKTAQKAVKIGLEAKEVKQLNSLVKVSKQLKVDNIDDLNKAISKLDDASPLKQKYTKIVNNAASVLEDVQKSSTPILGSRTLGKVAKTATEKIKVPTKTLTTGVRLGVMAPGLMAIPGTVATGFTEGWEYTKPEDISRILISTAAGKQWAKDAIAVRAIKRQNITAPKSTDQTLVKVGDKEITLNKALDLGKEKKSWIPFTKGKTDKKNAESLSKLHSEIQEAAKKQNITLTKEELSGITRKDISVNFGENSSAISIGKSPKAFTGDRSIDIRDYNIAKKELGKYGIHPIAKVAKTVNKKAVEPVVPENPVKPPKKKSTKKTTATTKKKKQINKNELGGILKFVNGGTGVKPEPNKPKEPNRETFLKKLSKQVDVTDLANAAMAIGTLSANKKAAIAQKKAALAGIVNLPTAPKQYFRTSTPMSAQAETQASNVQSQARRIGATTSDINKSMGIALQGNKQAQEIIQKGKAYDIQANAKLQEQQRASDAQTDAYNLEITGRNRASIANAIKSTHLVDANKAIANNTAMNNLITAWEKNLPRKDYLNTSNDISKLMNNPDFVKLREDYDKLVSPESQQQQKEMYDKEQASLKGSKSDLPWEKSNAYATYKTNIKAAEDKMKPFLDDLKNKQIALSAATNRIYLRKSGGSLSKQDRIDIDRERARLRAAQKDMELTYKAILHNNEMLQKALIKIFE